jgi:hypothetical protein
LPRPPLRGPHNGLMNVAFRCRSDRGLPSRLFQRSQAAQAQRRAWRQRVPRAGESERVRKQHCTQALRLVAAPARRGNVPLVRSDASAPSSQSRRSPAIPSEGAGSVGRRAWTLAIGLMAHLRRDSRTSALARGGIWPVRSPTTDASWESPTTDSSWDCLHCSGRVHDLHHGARAGVQLQGGLLQRGARSRFLTGRG